MQEALFDISADQTDIVSLALNTGFFDTFTFFVSQVGDEGLSIDNIVLNRLDDPALVSQPSVIGLLSLSLLVLMFKRRNSLKHVLR
ncbi:hypothetical protein PN836_001040 [Ningiella sp. W23]|uniref:hypothetical protein n=1 Tax=Ningiella sp. W23 TaxID=3023715 RepID=UPI0037571763